MRKIVSLLLASFSLPALALTTIEQCQQAAVQNYPVIKQYDLVNHTTQLTVANINKEWLPQVNVTAQATLQSDVTAWPEAIQSTFSNMGVEIEGLKKDQYRVGVDVNQTLYDGGAISSARNVAVQQGRVNEAAVEVTLYAVKARVNEMYFASLLLDDKIKLSEDLARLFMASEMKLKSLYERGAAAQSDYLSVKAERLKVEQQVATLLSQRSTLHRMLATFCGMEIDSLARPDELLPGSQVNRRPELELYDAQMRLADSRSKQLDSRLMPRLNLFAQGYYGYPGYNMFEDMMRRRFSWNGMVGVKLTWNVGALYTRKNDKAQLELQRATSLSNRETFLHNNELDLIKQNEQLDLSRKLVESDKEIVALRTSVRKSAESRLDHGIIDVHDLIKETNNEHEAMLQLSSHQIELLKSIYDIKLTTNN